MTNTDFRGLRPGRAADSPHSHARASTRRRRSRRRRSRRSSRAATSSASPRPAPARPRPSACRSCTSSSTLGSRPAPKTCRALILAPTRELAVQIEAALPHASPAARGCTTLLVLGGMSRSAQVRAIARGVDVVIATPGRLTDLMDDRSIRLDETRWVVLDEADRMLDMGFIQPVRQIVAALHPRRQSALFSATMPTEVAGLARRASCKRSGAGRGGAAGDDGRPHRAARRADGRRRRSATGSPRSLDRSRGVGAAIVFARTKRGADRVAENLEQGRHRGRGRSTATRRRTPGSGRSTLSATATSGCWSPPTSWRAASTCRASRHVINYDLPDEPESYVHRIGRTARNGAEGIAITLCAPDEIEEAARRREDHPDRASARQRGPRQLEPEAGPRSFRRPGRSRLPKGDSHGPRASMRPRVRRAASRTASRSTRSAPTAPLRRPAGPAAPLTARRSGCSRAPRRPKGSR